MESLRTSRKDVEAVVAQLSEQMTHWLACDLAEWVALAQTARDTDHEISQRVVVAIYTKRRWLVGRSTNGDLRQARMMLGTHSRYIQGKIKRSSYATLPRTYAYTKEYLRTLQCVYFATIQKASRSFASVWRNAPYVSFRWIQERALYLLEVSRSCGERACDLLFEGNCPVVSPLALSVRRMLDDSLQASNKPTPSANHWCFVEGGPFENRPTSQDDRLLPQALFLGDFANDGLLLRVDAPSSARLTHPTISMLGMYLLHPAVASFDDIPFPPDGSYDDHLYNVLASYAISMDPPRWEKIRDALGGFRRVEASPKMQHVWRWMAPHHHEWILTQ